MRPTLIVLSVALLLLVSTVAFYKACEPKPEIDPNSDALVAKDRASSPQASNNPAGANTAPPLAESEASPADVISPPARSKKASRPPVRSKAEYPDEGAQPAAVAEAPPDGVSPDPAIPSPAPSRNASRYPAAIAGNIPPPPPRGDEPVARAKVGGSRRRNVFIVNPVSANGSNLVDAAKDPNFSITMESRKDLIVGSEILKEGEYTLRLKNAGGSWSLVFYQGETQANVAVLPLRLGRAYYFSDKLMINLDEYGGKAIIRIHLRGEELYGLFELR